MFMSTVHAIADTHGPDITGNIVPMPSGSQHIIRNSDIPYFTTRPDAFVVNQNTQVAVAATDDAGNITGLVGPDGSAILGSMTSGSWMKVPSVFRLRLTGTGTCTLDARDSLSNITPGLATYTASNATDQIEFPYAGNNAVEIRATLTGTCTAEVI